MSMCVYLFYWFFLVNLVFFYFCIMNNLFSFDLLFIDIEKCKDKVDFFIVYYKIIVYIVCRFLKIYVGYFKFIEFRIWKLEYVMELYNFLGVKNKIDF